ncbi:MAG: hypothetical protein DRR16_16875 [Candidatus Parabeggiatoa sp. nov. 3]|nr:MAG: hypothetical protein DRQ99_05205 [Gammaproteobacteria bacterium]RKZ83607.1 MAG: hypothetical protein DRR16_16875 [Gammaproteobacteria bacterium]
MLKNSVKNISVENILKRLGKSLTWLAFTVFFGLLFPIGLVWLDSYLTTPQYFSFNSFFKNGTLMFFVMAVVASITVDYRLSTQTFGQIFGWIFIYLFPIYHNGDLCCFILHTL